MNPYPLALLNHFTVPFSRSTNLSWRQQVQASRLPHLIAILRPSENSVKKCKGNKSFISPYEQSSCRLFFSSADPARAPQQSSSRLGWFLSQSWTLLFRGGPILIR